MKSRIRLGPAGCRNGADATGPRPAARCGAAQVLDDADDVATEAVEAVDVIRRPATLAVAAQVHGDRVPARRPEVAGGGAPGVARLPAPVQQEDRGVGRVAERVGGERDLPSVDLEGGQ